MQTAAASGQLSSSSQQLATGCSEQASSVAETSAALEQMTAMIRNTAENANKAKDFAKEARQAAQIGAQTMTEMTTAMHAIEASSGEVANNQSCGTRFSCAENHVTHTNFHRHTWQRPCADPRLRVVCVQACASSSSACK